MKKIFNHKLFEIFFEKLLIAGLLLFAGAVANHSLERYKLIEIKRVGDTDAFVNACQEVWSTVYEYETIWEDINSLYTRRHFQKNLESNELKKTDNEITEKLKLIDRKTIELRNLTDLRKFVLGQDFVTHFWRYVGLIKASSEAKNKALEVVGEEAQTARQASESMRKQAISMRFNADMAREFAISSIRK